MAKEKLRVAVTGGRDYNDYYNVQRALAKVSAKFDIVVIHGAAKGADHWAQVWCDRTQTVAIPFSADWTSYGTAAGTLRNQRMIDEGQPQLLLAFPGGAGTRDMTNRCLVAGIPTKIIPARTLENDCS